MFVIIKRHAAQYSSQILLLNDSSIFFDEENVMEYFIEYNKDNNSGGDGVVTESLLRMIPYIKGASHFTYTNDIFAVINLKCSDEEILNHTPFIAPFTLSNIRMELRNFMINDICS